MAFRKARTLLVTLSVAAVLAGCSNPEQRAAKYIQSGMDYLASGQYEKARVEFKNAARIKPTDADVRYRLALVDEAQGNLRAAFLGFREAENQNPRFAPALLKLAQYYLAAEHYDEAQQRLDIVLADAPENAEGHAITAALLLRRGDHAGTEREARYALEKEPGNTTAVAVLTGLYTVMEQPERAVSVLEEGISRHPKDVPLLQLRVALFRKLGDVDKAVAAYEALFKAKPDDPALRSDLARMLLDAKRPDAAEQVLRDAVAQDGTNMQMKTRLIGFLSEVRGPKVAEAQIQAFIKAEPEVNTYRFWLADLKVRNGDVDGATQILRDVAAQQRMEPTGLTARAMLAKIDLGRGDREAAERLVKEILERAPTNADALFLRANLSFERGDFQSVVTDLRTILRDNPRNKAVYTLLAEALLRQGRLDLAIETLSQLRELAPEIWAGRVRLAQLYHMNGDSGRAMAELSAVAEAQPDYPVVWESIARIAIPLKDWKTAEDAIAHLDTIEGQGNVAKFLRGELLAANGKDEEAIKAYAAVIAASPNTPIAENAVSSVINSYRRLGKLEAGTKYLESLDLRSPASLTVLAECYSRLGKLDQAATATDAALAQSPPMPGPYILRARLYLTDGQRVPATDVLKRGIAANPGEVQLSLMLADLLGSMGRVPEAIAMYESALQRNPSLDVAANNMAQLIADHQYSDPQALEKARRVAERFGATTNPLFQDTLAWVYVRQGQVDRALPILARISGEKGIPKQVNYHYGKALMMNGDKTAAKQQLELAVSDPKPYPGIDEARQLLGQM